MNAHAVRHARANINAGTQVTFLFQEAKRLQKYISRKRLTDFQKDSQRFTTFLRQSHCLLRYFMMAIKFYTVSKIIVRKNYIYIDQNFIFVDVYYFSHDKREQIYTYVRFEFSRTSNISC